MPERLPAAWATAVGHTSDPVDVLKQQLREAQSAHDELLQQMKVAEGTWRRCIEEAEQKEAAAKKELQGCKALLEKQRPRRSLELSRLLRKLQRNVAREIRDAQQGFVIKKVTEKHGKTEADGGGVCPNTCVLKWCHVEESFGPTSKSVDLQTVQRLDFGPSARAAKLFPEVMPWLCFSVITGERSYDFIGSNESSTRCFVLCISRLCEKFAGGTFRTRHDFEVAKGWCKLKTGCQRRGRTLLQEFLTSVQHVGATLPPPVQPPVVELAGAAEKPMDLFDFFDEPSPTQHAARGPAGSAGSVPEPTSPQSFRSTGSNGDSITRTGSFQPFTRLASAGGDLGSNARGFVSWMTSGGQGSWPKPGETWVFTGCVEQVDLYRTADATEWVNEMACRSQSERRAVNIISALPQQNMVEIRGTDKLKFVKGWARMVDDHGNWLLEKDRKDSASDVLFVRL
ncbi:unnamed protein product [Durusdinium trenchii]|uniref:Uncharacterized protein n=1 Tax=Durusdinium trenchii TaxID=1381693 RepID=A0ABP0NFS2_9DINO